MASHPTGPALAVPDCHGCALPAVACTCRRPPRDHGLLHRQKSRASWNARLAPLPARTARCRRPGVGVPSVARTGRAVRRLPPAWPDRRTAPVPGAGREVV